MQFAMRISAILFGLSLSVSAQATLAVPLQFATIQAAVVAAIPGDTVEVAPGVYFENINLLGKAITLKSTQGAQVTIIDGNSALPCLIFVFGEGPGTIVEGFTLKHGLGTQLLVGPNGPITAGGGVYCLGSSPTVKSCFITQNSATRGGGAEISGSPLFLDCTFEQNTASAVGGAISVLPSGFPALSNCRINGNTSLLHGAGISCAGGSSLFVVNCLVTGNTLMPDVLNVAISTGSAVYLQNGAASLQMECSTVVANDAGSGATFGSSGSIGFLVINNSVVYGNLGSDIVGASGVATVTHSDIEGNYAGLGVISADPQYVDVLQEDFHLAPGSPCINSGALGSPLMPQLDLDGSDRVLYGAPDMGAYENSDISSSPFIAGNVAQTTSGPTPVLTINGQTGGADRRVRTLIGQANSMEMAHPATNVVPSHFAIYGFFGVPGPYDSVTLPLGIGDMIMLPCPMYPWAYPLLFTYTNSTAVDICGQFVPSHPTPWNSGPQTPVFFPLIVTFQGVVEETMGTFRVTNGVILVIE